MVCSRRIVIIAGRRAAQHAAQVAPNEPELFICPQFAVLTGRLPTARLTNLF